MSAADEFWSSLIEMNRKVDGLIDRCMQALEPSQPISREIPFYASIEAKFNHLPTIFNQVASANSDALEGNNVKLSTFTNGGSRVYVREIGFQTSYVLEQDITVNGVSKHVIERIPDEMTGSLSQYPINFRWNFFPSITQRLYSQRRVLAGAGGRALAGNHLAFREPLIIEPMEGLVFDCELLNAGMANTNTPTEAAVIISMIISGYREAM